jgi:hypothetical protein
MTAPVMSAVVGRRGRFPNRLDPSIPRRRGADGPVGLNRLHGPPRAEICGPPPDEFRPTKICCLFFIVVLHSGPYVIQ